jgi:hypothetical protein
MSTGTDRNILCGAKTPHGGQRPEYLSNPDRSRDPPSDEELESLDAAHWRNGGPRFYASTRRTPRVPGSKIWRKAREGKL